MKLVVGLGNPGSQYALTRHNVGFMVLDELARQHATNWRKEGKAEVAELRVLGQKLLLVKPQTFMNLSGDAVAPLMRFYRLPPESMLVVQDDLDSAFGLLRFRMGGRSGGQRGVDHLIKLLGSADFPRLKLGISRPPQGRSAADWVLSKFPEEERATLEELVRIGARAVEAWATAGLGEAQLKFNGTDLRPRPEPKTEPDAAPPAAEKTASDS
ncbi:PTH1 family peptidyl-tRNA hydrolase [Deinobacterium chartae]|uniref:Peptidyl-tRNA hydrolase n=1 Tax=Deinobacterium chartae TaxID=521158 RepID=A0A841I030_9DEIO|nr:aminoacyl-tRNA hydrolase [Deinobacterium chartae]MBB6099141.1 PTH1 family peptidyl-tRNA hydrolase [Deinobacterium chartae]